MFSGGMDSTWVAWHLKNEGYNVELFHITWTYLDEDKFEGPKDTEAAIKVADYLDLPLHILGSVEIPGGLGNNVITSPAMAAMILCHSTHDFDFFATGIEDQRMGSCLVECRDTIEVIARSCMPWVTVTHPREFKTKKEIRAELPRALLSLQSSPETWCGGCAERREKIQRWIRGLKS